MMLDVFASYELSQMRWVFEDIGTEEPGDIWEGLLVQMRDIACAGAIQAFDVEGKPVHVLRDTRPPSQDGLRLTVERALRTGQPALIGRVLVYPVKWRQFVQGAVAVEVSEAAAKVGFQWRVDSLLFYAGLFLAAAKGTETEALICRALRAQACGLGEEGWTGLPGFIADGVVMQPLVRTAAKYSQSDGLILITGERGSGKDRLAAAIHEASSRRNNPMHEFSTTVGSDAQFEAEVFGCEKGIAPGVNERPGHIRAAGAGTLFMNEIGDAPLPMQAKLLRLFEKGEFSSVGSTRVEKTPARFIAATNRDLSAMVEAGTFRADLYDRLNVLRLHVPPLRDHIEDLPRLARYFASRRPKQAVTPGAIRVWMGHDWPGNNRELKNRTERCLVAGDGVVTAEAASDDLKADGFAAGADAPKRQAEQIRELRKKSATLALVENGGDKKCASKQLGITVRALEKQIQEFNLYNLLEG